MDLRVTPSVLLNRSIWFAREHAARLARLQEQAATGKRLLRPSDDPAGSLAILAHQSHAARLETWLGNLRQATTSLDLNVTALREAANIFTSARSLALEGSHAGNDQAAYEALAQQVDTLLERLLAVANSQDLGRYQFAGTATASAPFRVAAVDGEGRPASVAYDGSLERGETAIGPQQTVATHYPGASVFQPPGGPDAFQALIALRDDLRNVAGLSDAQRAEALSQRIGQLDAVRAVLLEAIGEQAASLENLEALGRRMEDVQLELRKRTTELESADISEVVVSLQAQENQFRLALAASARVLDLSLLDFLG